MTGEHRLLSVNKTVAIADVTIPAGGAQTLDNHGIVFVGDRAGVVLQKEAGNQATVSFDTQREWTTESYDSANLPKIGEKVYLGASDGKLTKTASGNKLVGYYWGTIGGAALFSLHA